MIELKDINEACKYYTEESGIEVTPNAQELLFVVLKGIEKDPHPTWQISRESKDLQKMSERHFSSLPVYLRTVFRRVRARGGWTRDGKRIEIKQITTFDLAHQMTSLVDMFCDVDCN